LRCPFKDDTQYVKPSDKPFMINFRVDDLAQLRGAGGHAPRQSDFARISPF